MELLEHFWAWVPFVVALIVVIALHRLTWWLLLRDRSISSERKLPRQLSTVVIAIVGVVVLVTLIPTHDGSLISDATKGDLLGLLGLAITALLTLSSTTLAANAMAGLMLRMQYSFRPGDFVRVNDYFGRVTERGLFHTEIQTEDRDLLSVPNLYLATNPLRVVRSSGTVISAEVSLGYDVGHDRAEELLIEAAKRTELSEPFVWITELKDHAVVYRACGFLAEVKTLVTVRSRLRANILDTLHGAGVEIVSPSYMAQRPAPREDAVIPEVHRRRPKPAAEEPAPEELVFDKAEEAERQEVLNRERSTIAEKRKQLDQDLKAATDDDRPPIESEIAAIDARLAEIAEELDAIAAAKNDDKPPEAAPGA